MIISTKHIHCVRKIRLSTHFMFKSCTQLSTQKVPLPRSKKYCRPLSMMETTSLTDFSKTPVMLRGHLTECPGHRSLQGACPKLFPLYSLHVSASHGLCGSGEATGLCLPPDSGCKLKCTDWLPPHEIGAFEAILHG